jgi:hypothetical protein
LEKRGLTAQLQEQNCTAVAGLGWGDEMRVGLIGQVRRRWVPRGYKLEMEVEYIYEWEYLNLIVNGLAGEMSWDWTPNMKSVSIAPVLENWGEHGWKTVVWDRARGHRGIAYDDVKVQRIEQPPYSPQLNPAERMFEYLRDQIEGKVYGTIAAKKKAVDTELQKLVNDPELIKSLAGWDWIHRSVHQAIDHFTALH